MSKPKNKDFILDEAGQRQALEQLRSGKPLFGKGGASGPLLQQLLEAALDGEMAAYLADEGISEGAGDIATPPNRRNGRSLKSLRTNSGTFELSTPRGRAGTFTPELGAQAPDHFRRCARRAHPRRCLQNEFGV